MVFYFGPTIVFELQRFHCFRKFGEKEFWAVYFNAFLIFPQKINFFCKKAILLIDNKQFKEQKSFFRRAFCTNHFIDLSVSESVWCFDEFRLFWHFVLRCDFESDVRLTQWVHISSGALDLRVFIHLLLIFTPFRFFFHYASLPFLLTQTKVLPLNVTQNTAVVWNTQFRYNFIMPWI